MYNRFLQRLTRYIATLGPVGYVPAAPGTCGTIAAIPLVYALRIYGVQAWGIDERLILIGICIAAVWCINVALPQFYDGDPSEIVLDELVGFAVAMYTVPFTWPLIVLVTILFRVYDISKFLNINMAQQVPGALGVVLDDVLAGIFANITLYILLRLI